MPTCHVIITLRDRSTGLDGDLARFLKDGAHVLKIPIGFIVNLSIDYISCSYTHFG